MDMRKDGVKHMLTFLSLIVLECHEKSQSMIKQMRLSESHEHMQMVLGRVFPSVKSILVYI